MGRHGHDVYFSKGVTRGSTRRNAKATRLGQRLRGVDKTPGAGRRLLPADPREGNSGRISYSRPLSLASQEREIKKDPENPGRTV